MGNSPTGGNRGENRALLNGPNQINLDEAQIQAYNDFLLKVSRVDFYVDGFTFVYNKKFNLTEEEFKRFMKAKGVADEDTYGESSYSITTKYEQTGLVKKSIIIFVRKINRRKKYYNVLFCEGTQENGISFFRVGLTGTVCSLVTIASYCLVNPKLGICVGVATFVSIAGKVVYDQRNHEFTDVCIGYMLNQMKEARLISFGRSCMYLLDDGVEIPVYGASVANH